MFGKYNGFVSKAWVSACMYFLVYSIYHVVTARKSIWVMQSKRQFATRLKVHQKAVSKALAEHVCDTKHKIAWENSKVITTNNRYGQRRCPEAWHINMNNHALNRDDGTYLPEKYMHLIGR
jgi:hypothetical protein